MSDLVFTFSSWQFLLPNEGKQHGLSQIPAKWFIPDFKSLKSQHRALSRNHLHAYASSLKGNSTACVWHLMSARLGRNTLPVFSVHPIDVWPRAQLHHPLATRSHPPSLSMRCREQESFKYFVSGSKSNGNNRQFLWEFLVFVIESSFLPGFLASQWERNGATAGDVPNTAQLSAVCWLGNVSLLGITCMFAPGNRKQPLQPFAEVFLQENSPSLQTQCQCMNLQPQEEQ